MKFLHTTILTTFFCLSSLSLTASENNDFGYNVQNIPAKLKKNADAVVREYFTKFEVKSTKKATETVQLAVTIFNEKSRMNDLVVYYNKYMKVNYVQARLYDASGRVIKKFKTSDVSDMSAVSNGTLHSDSRVKYLGISHHDYPFTVEFRYQVSYKGLQDYPDWEILPETRTAVEKTSYELCMHDGLTPRYKSYNTSLEPTISRTGNITSYIWETKNVNAVGYVAFLPKDMDLFPIVKIEPTRFSVAGYDGNMSNWKTFGGFIYELNKGRDKLPNEMVRTVKRLTKSAQSDEEKIAILYKYLQQNTRYVSIQLGIGGWQTFDAEYVSEKKYGDCKALSYYMKGMLKEVGITAYPALIYGGEDDIGLDTAFSASDFNHVILYVPQKGKEGIWLECTQPTSPTNYLSSFTENRYALLITPEGGKLIETPKKDYTAHRLVNVARVDVNEKGAATASVESASFESEHDGWRYYYHNATKVEQVKVLQKMLDLPSYDINNLEIKVWDNAPRADLTYDLDIKRYAKRGGKRIFITPNFLNRPIEVPSDKIDDAQLKIEQANGFTHIDTVYFTLPSNFIIENLPEDNFKLNAEFGNYHVQVIMNGDKMTYIRRLELFAFSLPSERIVDLKDFFTQIRKVDAMKVVLVELR